MFPCDAALVSMPPFSLFIMAVFLKPLSGLKSGKQRPGFTALLARQWDQRETCCLLTHLLLTSCYLLTLATCCLTLYVTNKASCETYHNTCLYVYEQYSRIRLKLQTFCSLIYVFYAGNLPLTLNSF